MMKRFLAVLVLMLAALPAIGQQTFVIPVVTDETPGLNDSTWVTEVQVIKVHPHDSLTVRRLWVCTADGGFREEAEGALTWDMTYDTSSYRILVLAGSDLLEGTGERFGAVALEVVGGEAIVNARIADISRGVLEGRSPFGQGQRIPTDREALVGPSHIPWLGGCRNVPCSESENWDYYRVNIGLVNPNPQPLTVTATAIPFGDEDYQVESELTRYETFSVSVPAYGSIQFPWESSYTFGHGLFWQPYRAYVGFILNLEPASDVPYHAYSSTVFSPDPETGEPSFNDPMFVPASPGLIEPFFPEPE